jgi:hypothetical protein
MTESFQKFTGVAGRLRSTPWITFEMLSLDSDIVVEIEEVRYRKRVEFARPGTKLKDVKSDVGSLKFKNVDRELVLNATNLRSLIAAYGSSTADWYGKKVALFVDTKVKFGNKTVCAVRIRAKALDPATPIGKLKAPIDDAPEAAATEEPTPDEEIPPEREPGQDE